MASIFPALLCFHISKNKAKNDLVFRAGPTGLEPATYCVTGNRSNQLSYDPNFQFSHVAGAGLGPATPAL